MWAGAHPPPGLSWPALATRWTMDPLVFGTLASSALLYAAGVRRIWRRAGAFAGVRLWQVNCFGAGLISVIAALLSPLDALSDVLFAAHMTQHELLMLVAAPLLVAGRPLVVMLWALPASLRQWLGRALLRPAWLTVWGALSAPLSVLVLHALAIWVWHVPAPFEAALRSELVHAVQHLTLFGSAALFWWALVHGRYGRAGYGLSVLFVFATALHTSILGAVLAVSQRIWYPEQSELAERFGLTALDDQQLAGLIMWVPSGFVFVAIGLALFAAWLGEARRRVRYLEISAFGHGPGERGGAP